MIEYDNNWLAYTMSVWCANQYRVVDKSNPTYGMANQYVKYVKLFYRDKETKRHYLPPSTHKVVGGIDNFSSPELAPHRDKMYDYQQKALQFIHNLKTKSCLIRSWEWTGKSRIIVGVCSMRDNMAIVLVPTNMIQKQLQEQMPTVRVMCLPTFKKLYSTINTWVPIVIDESHRISEALRNLLCTWKGKIIWLTASPFRLDFQHEWFKIFFWELHETGAEALTIKVKPIKLITEVDQTDFMRMSAEYSSESTERRRKWLVMNPWRAKWIAEIAYKAMLKNNTVMVFSDRKEQVEAIHAECLKIFPDSYMMIWWKDNSKIKKQLEMKKQFIIAATIQAVWEWMDIPSLMVGISCFSTANYKTIRQMAWRMRRYCGNKTHWYLIDIIDTLHIWKIRKQFSTRYDRKKIYLDLWFTVDDGEIMKHKIETYPQDSLF